VLNFLIVSVGAGILFGFMDAVINANPLARRLNSAYEPIAKTEINVPAGIAIDLAYGVIMAAIFWLIASTLPGESGLLKGLSYGLIMWFFRVVMAAATTWMTHRVPVALLAYNLLSGLAEMLVLGAVIGVFLQVG